MLLDAVSLSETTNPYEIDAHESKQNKEKKCSPRITTLSFPLTKEA